LDHNVEKKTIGSRGTVTRKDAGIVVGYFVAFFGRSLCRSPGSGRETATAAQETVDPEITQTEILADTNEEEEQQRGGL
jgi:hypothetical protein